MIETFERVNSVKIHYEFTNKRPVDNVISYADVSKARKYLGVEAQKDLTDMCRDSLKWQKCYN